MGKRAPMHLSENERTRVRNFLQQSNANARNMKRAEVLLKSDEGWGDARIAETLGISEQTVRNIRKRFYSGGVEAVLTDKQQQRPRQRRGLLSDEQEARLIAMSRSEVPAGHDRWSVRLLADKAVELGYVERLSRETVRTLLKKHGSQSASNTSNSAP